MTSIAWPTVIAAVVTTAEAALASADVRVVRGRDISRIPGDVVMVGVQNFDGLGSESAGSYDQEFQTFGGPRLETGTVNGLVLTWNGDSDQDAAEASAFAAMDLLAAAIKATPALGVTAFDYLVTQFASGEVRELQDEDGATTWLPFVVSYQARIS